jgi:hypothetical protein
MKPSEQVGGLEHIHTRSLNPQVSDRFLRLHVSLESYRVSLVRSTCKLGLVSRKHRRGPITLLLQLHRCLHDPLPRGRGAEHSEGDPLREAPEGVREDGHAARAAGARVHEQVRADAEGEAGRGGHRQAERSALLADPGGAAEARPQPGCAYFHYRAQPGGRARGALHGAAGGGERRDHAADQRPAHLRAAPGGRLDLRLVPAQQVGSSGCKGFAF